MKLVSWLLWRIWKTRNALIFKVKEYITLETVVKAEEEEEEWNNRKANREQQSTIPANRNSTAKWFTSPQEWVKCNKAGAWL